MLLTTATAAIAGVAAYGEAFSAWATRNWPAEGEFTVWRDTRLHFKLNGPEGAQPVMLIHGASANAREFSSNLLPALEGSNRVLTADRPGHGHSGRPADGHRLAVQAEAMSHLLSETGMGPAVVVGHSFGGAVALRLALDHPEQVKALVLLAPASHPFPGKTNIHNRLSANSAYGAAYARLVPFAGPLLAAGSISNVFAPNTPPPGYRESLGLPLLFRPRNFRANAKDMSAANDEFAAQMSRYGQIQAPITVFSPARDHVLSPRIHARELVRAAPNADLIKLPEDGHMPHHFHAERIADVIRRAAR